jgi:hypothetical protein
MTLFSLLPPAIGGLIEVTVADGAAVSGERECEVQMIGIDGYAVERIGRVER